MQAFILQLILFHKTLKFEKDEKKFKNILDNFFKIHLT